MALRNIMTDGEPILRKRSREVSEINDHIRMILDDMLDTMYEKDGIGIAAPQIGILKRMFLVEAEEGDLLEIINPEIIHMEGSVLGEEGCLSVPGRYGTVERPTRVLVKGLDRYGKEFTCEAEGLKAVAICHEYDHLEGILFIDKAKDICGNEE